MGVVIISIKALLDVHLRCVEFVFTEGYIKVTSIDYTLM